MLKTEKKRERIKQKAVGDIGHLVEEEEQAEVEAEVEVEVEVEEKEE